MLEKTITVHGVGCCGLAHGVRHLRLHPPAAHGRACAVATGVKRANPDKLVFTYQGDGDLASIGLAETICAANRGENFTVIFVNNGIYGMTGGQMAPTTLVGMKATTAPNGRDPKEHGYPMHMCETHQPADRALLSGAHQLQHARQRGNKTKAAIKKAFQNQLDGKGFSMVEIVTSCPTNWGLDPLESLDFLEQKMLKEFPLGVIRDREQGGRVNGTESDGGRFRRPGRHDPGQVPGGSHLRHARIRTSPSSPPTAQSSVAAPPTAMWSSPTTTSARRWATAWTI